MFACPAHNKLYSNKSSKHDLCVKHHNNLNGNSNKKVNNNVTISDAPLNELPLSDNKNEKDPPKKYIPLKQNMLNNLNKLPNLKECVSIIPSVLKYLPYCVMNDFVNNLCGQMN